MEEFGGKVKYEFQMRRAASDGQEYPIEEAEDKDLKYLIENSCMICNRYFRKGEVRILPSSYMQEKDSFVREGIVAKRYICADCYNKVTSTAREKEKYDYRKRIRRFAVLIKGLSYTRE
ncbi:MAG: hypothetical protein QW774_01990 [Candidatus Micrarchaeaceae archaeon]